MNTKITLNGLASLVLASYGHHASGAWDFKTQTPVEAGDGLLTFLLSETTSAAHCDTTFETLAEAARLVETISQDIECTLSRLNLFIVNALTANYLEWFLQLGHKTVDLEPAIQAWSYTLKSHVRDAYGHNVMPRLEQLIQVLSDGVEAEALPQLMLQNLRQQLMIGSEFLPEGGNTEPLYACEISTPTETLRNGSCPPDGQAVPQSSVAGSPTTSQ